MDSAVPLTAGEAGGRKPLKLVRAGVRIAVVEASIAPRRCLFVWHPDKGLELPGGAIEPCEIPEDAARRELLEETGLCLDPHATLLPLTMVPVNDRRGGNWLDIVYWAALPQRPNHECPAELPIRWLQMTDVVEPLSQSLRSTLKHLRGLLV